MYQYSFAFLILGLGLGLRKSSSLFFLKSVISFASFPAHLRLGQSIKISSRESRFRKEKCIQPLHLGRPGAKMNLPVLNNS